MLRVCNCLMCVCCCVSLLLSGGVARASDPALPRLKVERPNDDTGLAISPPRYIRACDRLLRETFGKRATGENAWPQVVELINQHIALVEQVAAPLPGSDRRRRIEPDSLYVDNAGAQEWSEDLKSAQALAREMIATSEREGLFTKMAALSTRYNIRRPENAGSLSQWKFLAISNLREMMKLNIARMRLAAEAKDWVTLASAYEDTLMLARVASTDPMLISQLVGYAVAGHAHRELRRHVLADTPSAALLGELIEMIGRQGPHPAAGIWLDTEREFVLEMTEDAKFPDPKADAQKLIREFFSGITASLVVPRWERREDAFDAAAFVKNHVKEGTMLALVLPAFDTNLRSWDAARTEAEGTRVLLAVLKYKAENGAYPMSLAELVPAQLPALPGDPWSKSGLVYTRLEQPDDAGREFKLYSVGLDGEDNGATAANERDGGAFSSKGKGTDHVFNLPRRTSRTP